MPVIHLPSHFSASVRRWYSASEAITRAITTVGAWTTKFGPWNGTPALSAGGVSAGADRASVVHLAPGRGADRECNGAGGTAEPLSFDHRCRYTPTPAAAVVISADA